MTEPLLTPEKAAEHLGGLDPKTVTKWAREGKIPAFPLGEGSRRLWRFKASELDEWIEKRRTEHQRAA